MLNTFRRGSWYNYRRSTEYSTQHNASFPRSDNVLKSASTLYAHLWSSQGSRPLTDTQRWAVRPSRPVLLPSLQGPRKCPSGAAALQDWFLLRRLAPCRILRSYEECFALRLKSNAESRMCAKALATYLQPDQHRYHAHAGKRRNKVLWKAAQLASKENQ